jgi:hypothetical protein
VRRLLRPSKSSIALIAVLLALAGADLLDHVAIPHANTHNAADVCLAVVGGVAFAAAAVVAVVVRLPRPSYGTAIGTSSLCSPSPPLATARAGPIRPVVLRL